MGGVTINTDGEVLNVAQQSIRGAYAAGEVVGGIHGGNRIGGNAVADIIIFGTLAGHQAAKTCQRITCNLAPAGLALSPPGLPLLRRARCPITASIATPPC
ncbi:putative NADH:flavin oxidoreductase [Klebsiella pneumoniae]|uniref:Putative NADH:flavin oxidoreductase n=1 Tax=Klebsiella pneumoniae TaxID=573 RepID=A0A377X6Y7_KLEPN|nr:putative NADH:flavin oxidoreductase [Klebsiella pneumoniae]